MITPFDTMPLRQWRLKSFKSIADTTIDFRPLTLIVGRNSSGKTSLLQSILLFAQAAQASATGGAFPLNGPLVSLADYSHVACRFCEEQDTIIGGTLRLPNREERPGEHGKHDLPFVVPPFMVDDEDFTEASNDTLEWSLGFRGKAEGQPGLAVVRSASAQAEVTREDGVRLALSFESVERRLAEKKVQAMATQGRATLSGEAFVDYVRGVVEQHIDDRSLNTRVTGFAPSGGIPVRFHVARRSNELKIRRWLDRAAEWSEMEQGAGSSSARPARGNATTAVAVETALKAYHEFYPPEAMGRDWDFVRSAETFAEGLTPSQRKRLLSKANREAIVKDFIRATGPGPNQNVPAGDGAAYELGRAMRQAVTFLANKVIYLGPLREEPHQAGVYMSPHAGRTPFLGTRGEFLPAVLRASESRIVTVPTPEAPDGEQVAADQMKRIAIMPLPKAVELWLKHFRVADRVIAEDTGMGPGLKVVEPGSTQELSLTDVGIGVSQVLPVVAACLIADPGTVVILEQPELHLHPQLQQQLGDFLLACALTGRQLIVETHSEHIVSRLRRRLAESEGDLLTQQCAILFADRSDQGTVFRSAEPNRYGGLAADEWPEGFFDEGPNEMQRILEAAVEKLKNEEMQD